MAEGVGTAYARAAYEQQGVLATWFPDRVLQVGDIVSRDRRTGAMTVETNLSELLGGPAPETSEVRTTKGPARLAFQRGATMDFGLEVSSGVANARVTFTGDHSFVFAALDGSSSSYERLAWARQAIVKLAAEDAWRDEWQLVTGVRSFAYCLVMIARGGGAEARVGLDLSSGFAGFDAVQASLGASITKGDAVKWELATCTPLFEGLVLHRSLLKGEVVEQRYLEDPAAAPPAVVRSLPVPLDLD